MFCWLFFLLDFRSIINFKTSFIRYGWCYWTYFYNG
jgi:hypothetical protein